MLSFLPSPHWHFLLMACQIQGFDSVFWLQNDSIGPLTEHSLGGGRSFHILFGILNSPVLKYLSPAPGNCALCISFGEFPPLLFVHFSIIFLYILYLFYCFGHCLVSLGTVYSSFTHTTIFVGSCNWSLCCACIMTLFIICIILFNI
jgi:hypothetical protein